MEETVVVDDVMLEQINVFVHLCAFRGKKRQTTDIEIRISLRIENEMFDNLLEDTILGQGAQFDLQIWCLSQCYYKKENWILQKVHESRS